jgi:hypothetical protein
MGTEISRFRAAAGLASACAALAGATGTLAATGAAGAVQFAGAGAFAWLTPAAPPHGWRRARLSDGATLAYPPSWRAIAGDAGTATAGLRDGRGRFLGYLNVTPQQGAETLANFAAFRVGHNVGEGQRGERTLASGQRLRFRAGGTGSCVQDRYTTRTGADFVEIACLVRAHGAGVVIVAAAPPARWASERHTLQRAVASITPTRHG